MVKERLPPRLAIPRAVSQSKQRNSNYPEQRRFKSVYLVGSQTLLKHDVNEVGLFVKIGPKLDQNFSRQTAKSSQKTQMNPTANLLLLRTSLQHESYHIYPFKAFF